MISLQRILILSLVFMAFGSVRADGQDANYFPIEVGNSWEYVELIEGPFGEVEDSVFWGPVIVSDLVNLENVEYYVLNTSLFRADTLRADGTGNVMALEGGSEKLLFDFSIPDTSMYTYVEYFGTDSVVFQVTLSPDQFVETPSGNFSDCIKLRFEAVGAVDANEFYVFCAGSGIVQIRRGDGADLRLFSGNVGGEIVTHVGREENPEGLFSFNPVFPNPARNRAQIPFDVGSEGTDVQMVLFDLLGREKGVITNRFYNPGNHAVFVDVSAVPDGLYIVQSRVGLSTYNTFLIVHK